MLYSIDARGVSFGSEQYILSFFNSGKMAGPHYTILGVAGNDEGRLCSPQIQNNLLSNKLFEALVSIWIYINWDAWRFFTRTRTEGRRGDHRDR